MPVGMHPYSCSRRGLRSKRWALPIRMRPPLFFCLAKRKAAAAAVEKKSAISKLALRRKFGEYGSQLFCSKTCLSLRGTGGVRRLSSPVRRDGQAANLRVRKGHPQFLFPRSPRCSALPVPRMSASGSGIRSRGRPLCRPVNAALPNAGTQFCKERLSAQPAGGFGVCMAVCTERSPRCSVLPVPQMSASGSGIRSRGRPLCSPVSSAPPDAGAQFRKERLSAQPVESFWTLSAVRGGQPLVSGELTPCGSTHP